MLVLARKVEQRIQIGRDITITVLKIRNGAVKVGIEAPKGTPVFRTEVLARRAAVQPIANADPRGAPDAVSGPRGSHAAASTVDPAAGDVSTVAACEEDAERPMSERGAAVRIAPGPVAARQPDVHLLFASCRCAREVSDPLAALPAVTAVG
jgi:carbon storage regulator